MKLPMKSLLLKSFKEKDQWEQDAINDLMVEEGLTSDYWKWNARFWLAEMQSCGLLKPIEQTMDDGHFFEEGKVLTKYKLTPRGMDCIESMLE